ncbi:MAG: prepilin-type N-terminal cleavage/methylation domain-containing protein [Proteobacteria bacterium]|nr:prepilin-type N-terminal cleavage/methylation domain-containing protein [Pseudomonadota bacterium]MBU4298009.1 prepilin-type N-terminal cleavage/methylation domain-containing protein [Pseudomonadota bacterium]MCG2749569.1 prepilin-type N-terminal cleavage/methylation domain-containing protein [Desulfobulbaceae bacterium]
MKKRFAGDTRSAGFSLFELLTVLVMLGIMAGIAAPSVGNFLAGLDFRKQVGDIMAHMRAIRLQAVISGQQIKMSLEDHNLLLDRGQEEQEVQELDLNPESELTLEPPVVIFTPQSTVTPATISLSSDGRNRTISLDPLTALPVIR